MIVPVAFPMDELLNNPLAIRILAHADDKLLLGHVQSDWTGLGPILEEDIASSAMSQDDLSHALTLYEYLADRFDLDPDVIAFERSPEQYFCCDLASFSDDFDWANSVVKRWIMAVYTRIGVEKLAELDEETDLAARCGRILPEQRLQITHLEQWIHRLADGGPEARQRMQKAVDRLVPLAGMALERPGPPDSAASALPLDRGEFYQQWMSHLEGALETSGLSAAFALPDPDQRGGRSGHHAQHFLDQLEEMTEVRRIEPGASW